MKLKEQVLSLKAYQPGKSAEEVKRLYQLDKIIKLASNENPFGCSPNVLDKLRNASINPALYPDGNATNLRLKMSEFLRVEPNQLIFGSGSDEIIRIISRAYLKPECNTIMATPTFPQYKHNSVIEGATTIEVPLVHGHHDLQAMMDMVDVNTRVVWLCSPNNPTGTYINEKQLIYFLDNVSTDVLVVLDEAYFEYVDASDYYDSIKLTERYKNLVVLRTFSKIYGLAGLRVGYAVGNPTIISGLEPIREPFNVNFLAQLAAETAISDQVFVAKSKISNKQGLQLFYDFCNENNITYYPSQGNFILMDFKLDADDVAHYLLERGYIVRSGKGLGFPTSIRITVGKQDQNVELIGHLKEFIAFQSKLSS